MDERRINPPLSNKDCRLIDAWWRAANYLSIGQIYLLDNPLLQEKLTLDAHQAAAARPLGHDARPELPLRASEPGHQGADLDMIYVAGPGHGGPGMVANTWLEGTYSEVYPHVPQNERGMQRLFKQFTFPGGIPSHVAPETPGSIHEGGELGYALSHAYGAAFDNPGPRRCLRRRRRRGRDRPAGHLVAFEQIPEPGDRRRGAADPASQRLQDRQPDDPRAHPARTSCSACSTAMATSPISSRATTRPSCTGRWRRPWT